MSVTGRPNQELRDSPQQARLRIRIRVWVRRWRLDRELASGRWPDPSRDLSVRAAQLAGEGAQREIACSLRRLVSAAERPRDRVVLSAAPLRRAQVVRWREGLLGLAERLEAHRPVNPCGVARAMVLLCDGTGPLYNPRPERSRMHCGGSRTGCGCARRTRGTVRCS